MERIDKIKSKLAEMGVEYNDLKPFIKGYLDKVEEFIEDREKRQNEAIETFKNALYNVSDVSRELGCSRTTLYNHNQLLKRYIETSIAMSDKNNPYVINDELKKAKHDLQEQINLMEDRDIDIEIQKHEKKVLTDKIAEQAKEIERLRARVFELSAKLNESKR